MAARPCAQCHDRLSQESFSRNQWMKGSGVSRCKNCVAGKLVSDVAQVEFDGACSGNPGKSGAGALCKVYYKSEYSAEELRTAVPLGTATNNVAEYFGLITGLRKILRKLSSIQSDPRDVYLEVIGDSQLVIRQMTGEYRVQDPTLRQLHAVASGLVQEFSCWQPYHVPRDENKEADTLARRALRSSLTEAQIVFFYPNLCQMSRVRIGNRSVLASNDYATSSPLGKMLIDADFFASLDGFGLRALHSLADPHPLVACTGIRGGDGLVLGILRRPLPMSIQFDSGSGRAQSVVVSDAVVVQGLPVPLHVSAFHPSVDKAQISMSFGTGLQLERDNLPTPYSEHRHWTTEQDVVFLPAHYFRVPA